MHRIAEILQAVFTFRCFMITSISNQISSFRGKWIQTHEAPRLRPKTAWVHYRWGHSDTQLCIQAEKERLFRKRKWRSV